MNDNSKGGTAAMTRNSSAFICVHLRFPRLVLITLLLATSLAATAQLRPSQPEPPSGWTEKRALVAKRHVVVAAHPLAAEAGFRMLEKGGSAVDAAIATQLVLGLVEPHASGLGGGAFLLAHDAKAKRTVAIDARETAPSGANPQLFLGADGKPMKFQDAVVGGRSVGVPGTPRLLEVAHARMGRLPWAALFQPAIEIAEKGFPMSPRLHTLVGKDKALAAQPAARDYFFGADGQPKPVGTLLRNPAYAKTLRAMAAKGSDAFYTGEIAADIVAAVRNHANPGSMTLEDLAGYRVRDVEPLCGPYRAWQLCGMPPSSSGGIAVLQMLGMLEGRDLAAVRPGSAESVHLLAEAGRLAFADRGRYVGDDRFVEVPVQGLVDKGYLAQRAKLIAPEKSMGRAQPGTPPGLRVALADDPVDEVAGTSHIAIVDAQGNAVSMTTTIEGFFGSKQMVRGFLLNNELTDFNFQPQEAGREVANAVAPGKRPRSSMAPFLVFDAKSGRLEQAVGSPGGSLIINYVAKALVATLDWKMDMQAALSLPNFGSRGGPTEVEAGTELEKAGAALKAMGHEVRAIDMTSGLAGIRRTAKGWEAAADPRREGVARGR
ncbi:MAG TPA: gamma-glutamyltransferase [Usitatibacteraceae bacterium]|nr:gamma-glutamyltransferase [Usitatibacteraceae bacterium]